MGRTVRRRTAEPLFVHSAVLPDLVSQHRKLSLVAGTSLRSRASRPPATGLPLAGDERHSRQSRHG